MKQVKAIVLFAFFIFSSQFAKAQTTSKTFKLNDFDKVQIENVNGQIEIELGKPFSITITYKEAADEQINVSKVADKLILQLDEKYVRDWKKIKPVVIKISMPEISKLSNISNADVSINKFVGRYLGIDNNGNGNVMIVGTVVDFIEITNNGNGNIETKTINAKRVIISKSGNGDVSVTTDNDFKIEMAGNGDIVNYGKGKAIIDKQSGTGKVVYRN